MGSVRGFAAVDRTEVLDDVVDVRHLGEEEAELPAPQRHDVPVAGLDVAIQVRTVRAEVAQRQVDVLDGEGVSIGVDPVAPILAAAILALDHDGSSGDLDTVVPQEAGGNQGDDREDDRWGPAPIGVDPGKVDRSCDDEHEDERQLSSLGASRPARLSL